MSDRPRDPLAAARPLGAPDPEGERAREARHRVLSDLLAAHADDELPPETASQVEAHLVGCARCRRELAVHHAVRRRLGEAPLPPAPRALHDRIALATAALPAPAPSPVDAAAAPRRASLS